VTRPLPGWVLESILRVSWPALPDPTSALLSPAPQVSKAPGMSHRLADMPTPPPPPGPEAAPGPQANGVARSTSPRGGEAMGGGGGGPVRGKYVPPSMRGAGDSNSKWAER
jgi:hypothetical protein